MTEHLNLPAQAEQLTEQRFGKQPGELDSARVPTASKDEKGSPWERKKNNASFRQLQEQNHSSNGEVRWVIAFLYHIP